MSPVVKRRAGRFAELAALCGLTVAQPVLSTFGENATDLVFRRSSTVDLIVFTLLVIVVPPLVLWAAGVVVDLVDEHWGQVVHHCLVGLLIGLLALQLVKDTTTLTGPALLAVGVAGAVLGVVLRAQVDAVGTVLRYLVIAPVLFAVNFLFFSPASGVVFADGTAEAAQLEMATPTDLVVLVFDELPTHSLLDDDSQVDPDLWPGFAALAEQSTWYRNATSVSPTTPTAVPALFSGQLPTDPDALPLLDDHPQNLFTLFGGTHDVHAHESVAQLCPTSVCTEGERPGDTVGSLVDDAVDVWWRFSSLEEPEEETIDFKPRQSDPTADEKINAWLDGIEPGDPDRDQLAVLHAVWPHQPWWRTPDGRRYDAPIVAEGLGSEYSWADDNSRLAAQQRHLMQLQYTDRQLTNIIETLRQRQRWDDALVIVTADHGVSFSVGDPIRGLGDANDPNVAWIPFFVKEPGQTVGRIDERPTSTLDLVPTLVAGVGATSPWQLDGLAVSVPRIDTDVPFADWSLNTRPADNGLFATIDGEAGYAALLASEPAVTPGDSNLRLYQWGAYGDLVGRPLDLFTIGDTSRFTMAVEDAEAYVSYDPDTERIPIYVSGFVAPEEPAAFAVVMNGTVAMWGESKLTGNGHRLWATVLPDTVQPGPNDLQVFEITTNDDALCPSVEACVTFHPVSLSAAPEPDEE
ncbi:MAG: sulfatase-like hydrolase/transferase [Acidimicrobiia bacterium]|nr:sulfatase-like hydrolase/transferase [Acidimicrobiia bacterium]